MKSLDNNKLILVKNICHDLNRKWKFTIIEWVKKNLLDNIIEIIETLYHGEVVRETKKRHIAETSSSRQNKPTVALLLSFEPGLLGQRNENHKLVMEADERESLAELRTAKWLS